MMTSISKDNVEITMTHHDSTRPPYTEERHHSNNVNVWINIDGEWMLTNQWSIVEVDYIIKSNYIYDAFRLLGVNAEAERLISESLEKELLNE